MKELCESKYKQETTEQAYILLQQHIADHNSTSQSFESSPIAQSTLIDSIQNVEIRRQLVNQYREVALQARANLFRRSAKSAQDEREEYQKNYEDCVKKMWTAHRSTEDNQHIPLNMIDLISQRCEKITKRIRCIYKFKATSSSSHV